MNRLYVHLSPDRETAINVGRRHGRPLLLCVNSRQMKEDGYLFSLRQLPTDEGRRISVLPLCKWCMAYKGSTCEILYIGALRSSTCSVKSCSIYKKSPYKVMTGHPAMTL